tara:strand:- start:214 stop:450 length:237 start_codon:yes stop_codon:yes gene_type:complete
MAYKQKYTKSAFPFKSPLKQDSFSKSFDKAFDATANANKIIKSQENSEVPETTKVNGVECATFSGKPTKYDDKGLVKK